MRIENIAQAQEAAAAIADFWANYNHTLSKIGAMTGVSNGGMLVRPTHRTSIRHNAKADRVSSGTPAVVPLTMPERVTAILSSAASPLTPKEILARYENLGWPKPKSGKTYRVLLSCAYY